ASTLTKVEPLAGNSKSRIGGKRNHRGTRSGVVIGSPAPLRTQRRRLLHFRVVAHARWHSTELGHPRSTAPPRVRRLPTNDPSPYRSHSPGMLALEIGLIGGPGSSR